MIERWLAYPAPPLKSGDWQSRWIDKEEAWFHAADGTRLHGWYVPHARPRHVILYSHGASEHVGNLVNTLLRLEAMLDASVFVYDYRGYGRSAGRPSEAGLIADGIAAQAWLAERVNRPVSDIVLVGRSLGGGVSVAVAAERGARALVLDATFSRLVDAASHNYPWLPVRTLMRDRFDSLAQIAKYHGPVFQSHRATDEVVPIELARQIIDRAPGSLKQFHEIPSGRHNAPLPPEYYSALREFLGRVDAVGQPMVPPAVTVPN